jgi:hypothetical protein|uniref:Nucelotide kinase n=1 Tax=Siphoviridae sp. ctmwf23 TaxID=2827935 RepID=A0A8S5T7W1_9CAUD|nr:MAG TPA: nucelotide kinase [Siphoviridae sp. ctmwf23]
MNALDTQVGGSHYKNMRFQPIELISLLGLDFFQGNVVKYVSRHHEKGGREDLDKARHYCQLAMSYGYGRERLPTKAQTARIAVFVSMNSLPAYTAKRFSRLISEGLMCRNWDLAMEIIDEITQGYDAQACSTDN